MTAQTILEARLRAKDDGLVGQLTAAEARVKGVTGALGSMAGASRNAAAATDKAAASDREAARAARDLESARKAQEAASRSAARAEQQAAQQVQRALSSRQQGQRQLGFQLQDFFVQVGSGQSILTAFSQQASQATGALALLGDSGTAAKGKMGSFLALMGGPFGIALGVAIPLVSLLAAKLFESGEAAKAAEVGATGLANAQSVLGEIFDLTTGKIKEQNDLLILNARLTAINLRNEAAQAKLNSEQGLASAADAQFGAGRRFLNAVTIGNDPRLAAIEGRRQRLADLAKGVQQGGLSPSEGVRLAGEISFEGTGIDQAEFLTALRDRAVFRVKEQIADEIDKTLDSGQLSAEFRRDGPNPRRRRSGSGAAALERFGDSAGERIARIGEAYDPAPRGLDKAFADLRSLDRIIEDLGKRKPPSFEALIGEAKEARGAVLAGISAPIDAIQEKLIPLPAGLAKAKAEIAELDGIIAVLTERKPPNWEELVERATELKQVAADTVRGPLDDMLKASREQRAQQLLILQGREREAAVLARIQQLQSDGSVVAAEQRREVEAMVDAEERLNDLLAKRQDIIGIYSASIGDLRSALEELLSGGGTGNFFKDIQRNVKQLQGRLLTESLFGDSLRALEKKVRGQSPIDREVDDIAKELDSFESETERAGAAAKLLAAALGDATAAINRTSAGASIRRGASTYLGSFGGLGNVAARSAAEAAGNDEIVVTANRPKTLGDALGIGQTQSFIEEAVKGVATPLAELFDEYLGTKFFQKLVPALSGGVAGFFTAGPVGGVLGALKSIPGDIGEAAGAALKGAQTGTAVAGIAKALGIKTSTTGAQIGGAIGSALPIPGGDIIGAIAGGLIGGALKPAKRGSATITSVDGDAVLSGNSNKFKAAAGDAAGSVQGLLKQIADQLGGELGSFAVSIGVRDGKFRVDPTGRGVTKTKKGALDFGEDGEAAVLAAAFDAIGDGAIGGLTAAVQKALRSSSDIEKAVAEALKVQEVEELLGGLGSQLQKQFREFENQAKERVRIATQYGFDVVAIEARNAEDRAKLIDDILTSRVGSLQDLLKDIKFGDLFEGTASERRDRLTAEIASARSDAEKGVDGAADRLADLSRQLIETSREAFGTAGPEFASDRASTISTAEAIIAAENERVRAAQQAAIDTSRALQTNNQLTGETNDILAEIRTILGRDTSLGVAGTVGVRIDVSRAVDIR